MVQRVRLANQVRMERMVTLDHKDYRDCLGLWELLVTKAQWVNRVNKETLVLLDPKDQEETLVRMVFPEILVLQDHLDLLEKEVLQAVLVQEDSKVCQVHQEKMECQVKMEKLDCRGPLE